jgi:hypothetical protein
LMNVMAIPSNGVMLLPSSWLSLPSMAVLFED